MKIQTNWKNLCFWAILSIIPFTFISCSGSDSEADNNDFTGIWKEDYSEFFVDGVKVKTIENPYTEFLTGGLGYGVIDLTEEGYPYRNRARLYHEFYGTGVVATYGYNDEGESMMDTHSKYDYKQDAKLLIINDSPFEIMDKRANSFVVKEDCNNSLVALLRDTDAYICGENCYVLTHYKKVSKLGE